MRATAAYWKYRNPSDFRSSPGGTRAVASHD
jgi:hypothetical protein